MRRALATSLAAALLLLVPVAHAAAPRASLPDIEDEVMCLVCGTALNVSQAPSADQERALIRRLIAQGLTKQQIKDRLVDEYGEEILATPEGEGFDLAAWIVPLLLVLSGAGLVAWLVHRWRRRGDDPDSPSGGAADALSPEDARRLDDELAAFDR